jgi:hypothetical protein
MISAEGVDFNGGPGLGFAALQQHKQLRDVDANASRLIALWIRRFVPLGARRGCLRSDHCATIRQR